MIGSFLVASRIIFMWYSLIFFYQVVLMCWGIWAKNRIEMMIKMFEYNVQVNAMVLKILIKFIWIQMKIWRRFYHQFQHTSMSHDLILYKPCIFNEIGQTPRHNKNCVVQSTIQNFESITCVFCCRLRQSYPQINLVLS